MDEVTYILQSHLPYRSVQYRFGRIWCWSPKNMEGDWLEYKRFIEDVLKDHNLKAIRYFDVWEPERGTDFLIYVNEQH